MTWPIERGALKEALLALEMEKQAIAISDKYGDDHPAINRLMQSAQLHATLAVAAAMVDDTSANLYLHGARP